MGFSGKKLSVDIYVRQAVSPNGANSEAEHTNRQSHLLRTHLKLLLPELVRLGAHRS